MSSSSQRQPNPLSASVSPSPRELPYQSQAAFSTPLRVLIAEDNPLFALALSTELQEDSRFKLTGHAQNGQEAIDLAQDRSPDIVLLDVTLPDLDGIQVAQTLRTRCPDIKIVMLTCITQIDKVAQALQCGANAYCLKDIDTETLCTVMIETYTGEHTTANVSEPSATETVSSETTRQESLPWIDPAITLLFKNRPQKPSYGH